MYQYFEAEEESKKLQQLFIHRIMKMMAFKKWARFSKSSKTNDPTPLHAHFKEFNIEDGQDNQIRIDQLNNSDVIDEEHNQDKQDKLNRDSQNRPIINLKFGDIIYLKYYADNSQKGIISGDGIASNKLECLPQKLYDSEDTQMQNKIDDDDMKSNKSFSQKKDYLDSIAKTIKQTETTNTSIFRRSAEQQFRKCLFRVINEKKYFYQEKQQKQKVQQNVDSEQLVQKVVEEKKENTANYERLKGTNICYGQVIQLVHLYSDCSLTLNPNVLAQQNCCREMSLEEVDNQWSNFVIVSLKNTKKFGEPVLYGDQIHLQSQIDKGYWLNIDTIQEGGSLINPLEVNASEFNTPLKLCNYLDHKTSEERDSVAIKGKILQSGEVVRLFNRSLNGFIGVKRRSNFTKIFETRTISFVEDSNEIKMRQDYFDRVKSITRLQHNFILYVHQKEDQADQQIVNKQKKDSQKKIGSDQQELGYEDNSQEKSVNVDIQTLWEIQKEESFSSRLPSHKGYYRLKNLASGLYLCIGSKNNNDAAGQVSQLKRGLTINEQFILTFENSSPQNLFKLPSAKNSKRITRDESIQYNNSIMIQGSTDSRSRKKNAVLPYQSIRTLVLQDKREREKKVIHVECIARLEKQSKEKYSYEILSVSKDLRQTTDRVSSLFPFLLDFFIFLQDWGHIYFSETKEIKYAYKQAFDNQKILNNKVLEFTQSIDNLSDFLDVANQNLLMRQDVIRESGLLTLLILILQQIDFKIYGSIQQRDKNSNEKNIILSERSAQKIAQQKLKKTISIIYKILIQCIKGNSKSCSFLISSSNQYLSFLLKQLNKYPKEVKQLIREAIKWMEESDEKEQKNIANWCNKVSSLTSQNIGIQIFVMEILSLSLVDPMEVAIEENQKFCKNILFKVVKDQNKSNVSSMQQVHSSTREVTQYFNISFEQKKLISFMLITENIDGINCRLPCIVFNLGTKTGDMFDKENQKLKWIIQYKGLTDENQSNAFPFYAKGEDNQSQTLFASKNLKKYDQYVISVLNFYAQMCKGRNFKVIRLLKSPEIGLTDEFILTCLKMFNPFSPDVGDKKRKAVLPVNDDLNESKKIKNLDYYRCFLALYQETMLDADPLLRISESKVNSMVKDDIKNFQISDKSYKLFHDFVLSENRYLYTVARLKGKNNNSNSKGILSQQAVQQNDEDAEEYEEIRKFADQIVDNEESVNKVSSEITSILFSAFTSSQVLSRDDSFSSSDADCVLKTFLQMLKVVHSRIDLGYNNLYTNSHILKYVNQIFLAYIRFKSNTQKIGKDSHSQSNWVHDLMLKSFSHCKDSFLITKVVLEASKIIQVLDILQRNLIIVSQIQQNMGYKLKVKFQKSQQIKQSNGQIGLQMNGGDIEMQNLLKEGGNNEQCIILTTENVEEEEDLYNKEEQEQNKDEENDQKNNQKITSSKVRESYEQKFKKVKVGDLEFDLFRQNNFSKLKKLTKEEQELYKVSDLSIGSLLFLSLKYSLDNPTLQRQLSEQLINYIQQNKILISLFDQIEIIDDKFELSLLRDLCGDTKNQISAKDMTIFAQKLLIQFNQMKEQQKTEQVQVNQQMESQNLLVPKQQTLHQQSNASMSNLNISQHKQKYYLEDFTDGLNNIFNLFKLENYESSKKKYKLAKTKEDYFTQLQNLIRNTSFHQSMLMLISQSKLFTLKEEGEVDIKDDAQGTYKNLFSSIVDFLYLFVKDNPQNRQEVLPYFKQILELALFQYDSVKTFDANNQNFKNRPLKINKLCIELLQDKKRQIEQIKPYIQIIFDNIEKNEPEEFEKSQSSEDIMKSIMKKQAICQYLKILISLTTEDYNKCIKFNQQKIMDNILNSQCLKKLSKPFTNHDLEVLNAKRKKKGNNFASTYYIFKMHELCFSVLASCCKNHKLLIQEIHRMISSDSLKNTFIHPGTPYMLKRAYLKLLFETYIMKDDGKSSNQDISDVMPSEEIAEVIELIYKIVDDKNNYMYLEGLVKIDAKQQDESWKIRSLILQEKINEAKNKNELSGVSQKAKAFLDNPNKFKNASMNCEYDGILKDPCEYWRFVLNEGVVHFLTDTFDERINELGQSQKSTTLKEQYSKIKKMFANIINLLNKLETSYRTRKDFINLDYYKSFMKRVNDIIPKYKSQKAGESFKLGVTQEGKKIIQTYNTRKEDLQGGGFQDVEDDNKNDCEFYKFMRIFLMRNRIEAEDFCNNLVDIKKNLKEENTKPILKDAISSIINRDKFYLSDQHIIDFLTQECQLPYVMRKQPLQLAYLEDKDEKTDFIDSNIAIVIKVINKNLEKKGGPQDIAEMDKEDEEDNNNKDVISAGVLVQSLDLVGLRENLKIKLVKQTQAHLKAMKDILKAVDVQESPFSHFEQHSRIMEEVYITQILFEQIKKADINLFCEGGDDNFDLAHQKNLSDSVTQFIEASQQIFSNQQIYLIKFVRVLLELKQINQDTIEDKTSKDKVQNERANKKVHEYKYMQNIVGKSKIHEPVINKIIKSNYANETIESLVLLVQLLNYGNSENQQIILAYLKNEKEICLDFFSYLRDFFQNKSSENLIQIKESRRKIPKETVYFEILQLFCENVNESFQNFLRQQNDIMGIYSANTNVVMETSNFLSFLLEDNFVSMDCKSKLIRQCLETLVDFSTGAGQNQSIICQNKRLFSFLQDKILDMKIDFQKPKQEEGVDLNETITKQENKIELLISSIKFLITMVQGNEDTQNLVHILNHIECDKMIHLLYKIYKERLKPLQKNLLLEIICPGNEKVHHENCNDTICVYGYCTDYDIYLYEIGFQIFIMFCYLMEIFPEEHALDPFTKLLDSKFQFNIFNFTQENEKIEKYINQFNKNLRNQIPLAQKKKIREGMTYQSQEYQQSINDQQSSHNQQLHLDESNLKSAKDIVLQIPRRKEKSAIVKIFTKTKTDEKPKFSFDVNFNIIQTLNKLNQKILGEEQKNKQAVDNLKNDIYKQQEQNQGQDYGDEYNQLNRPKSLLKILLEAIQDTELINTVPRFFFFFKNQVGITEIFINDKVQLFYFQKPFCSNFLSPYIKHHLIYESNRESDEDRLLFMLDNYQFYYKQMIYKQFWYQYNVSWFMENWRAIKDVQFFFLLLIVFLQLFFLDGAIGDSEGSDSLDNLTQIFTIIQLVLTFLVLVFCGIERFKISINRFTNADSWRKIQYLKENAGLASDSFITTIYKMISVLQDDLNPERYKKKPFIWRFFIYTFLIISDYENFYHACYLATTLAGFFLKGPLIYGILLLDIVKRSSSLQQIIKSITQNLKNIFIFTYLGVIVMYIYGIGGFYYFRNDFLKDQKAYNNSFVSTVASVINMGLRNGGGISESLQNIASYSTSDSVTSDYFWGRYFYDISFFILINMLFIQIIFGIILDTFEELRKDQDAINEEVLNKCFVCSMSRGYIDSNSEEGWYYHIYLLHNAYHLVFFLIYITRKDETECNSIEKYVKKQIEQKSIEFIPVRQSTNIEEQEPISEEK